jgi:hypothetical protein
LRIAANNMITEDAVPLIERIPTQAWNDVLFSGPPSLRAAGFLETLQHMAPTAMPPVPDAWLADWAQLTLRHWRVSSAIEFSKAGEEYFRHMARRLLQLGTSPLDWDALGAGLDMLAQINKSLGLSGALIQQVAAAAPEPLPLPVPRHDARLVRHGLQLAVWVRASSSEALWSCLPDWYAKHADADVLASGDQATDVAQYHGVLANAFAVRLARAQDPPATWPRLSAILWGHLLRATPSAIVSCMQVVGQPPAAGRPDPLAVAVHDPDLLEVFDRLKALPEVEPALRLRWNRLVLELRARLEGDRSTQPQRKPSL